MLLYDFFISGIVHQKFKVYTKEALYHEKWMDRLRFNFEKKHMLIERRLMRAEEKAAMTRLRGLQRAKDAEQRELLRKQYKTARTTELAAVEAMGLAQDELKRLQAQIERVRSEGGAAGPTFRPMQRAERSQQSAVSAAVAVVSMLTAETEAIIQKLCALEPVSARSASDAAAGAGEEIARARVVAWIEREDKKRKSETRAKWWRGGQCRRCFHRA